jgi:hypothetical protein
MGSYASSRHEQAGCMNESPKPRNVMEEATQRQRVQAVILKEV